MHATTCPGHSGLSASATETPLQHHGLVITDGLIEKIAPNNELKEFYPDAQITDLSNCAVSSGFVDAHRHCYGVLAHGIPTENAPADFWAFLNEFWWGKIEDRLDHDMLRAAMDLACYDMIRSGVTSFFDCLEAPNTLPGGLFMCKAKLCSVGACAACCASKPPNASAAKTASWGCKRMLISFALAAMRKSKIKHQKSNILSGAMCHHTTFTCSDGFIRKAHGLAKELGSLLHFHCSEGTYEPEQCLKNYGHRTIEHYEQLGILDETTMASQCVQLSAREVEIVGRRGIRVTTHAVEQLRSRRWLCARARDAPRRCNGGFRHRRLCGELLRQFARRISHPQSPPARPAHHARPSGVADGNRARREDDGAGVA